ncbi:hypothetical protein M9H77_29681 [Catharanthus roseus]|uniref:Uncharacterized protein n=1 Tax=Catharanthus roseus TaxID=4058 RepID=A0ACB9ZVH6_CATRO|nr:hypothetical protein M9H77_29681 [Catharanthus roseus]
MTQPQMELPTHCYCGIYNVIRTSMTRRIWIGNLCHVRRRRLQTNKLEMEKTSYQMKMKAWLVVAIVSWVLLIVLGIRKYGVKPKYKFQRLLGLNLVLQPFEIK